MRRILGPAGVALALVVAPTTATAACGPTDGPRYDAHIASREGPHLSTLTRVVVCDRRRGRARVVARAEYRFLADRGALLEDVQATGHRVAWIAGATRGNRWTAVVTVADARTGRRLSRRTVASWRRGVDPGELSELNIALTTRGELGWIAPAPSDPRAEQVTVARPGLARRVVAEGRTLSFLAIEDDRTLRWRNGIDLSFHDIRPAGPGCPGRSHFTTQNALEGLVVTRAVYRHPDLDPDAGWDVVRVCDVLTGRDPVVVVGELSGVSNDLGVDVAGGRAPWALVEVDSLTRYDGCSHAALSVVNVRTGAASRFADGGRCDGERRTSITFTDGGAPAWMGALGTEQRIAAIAAGGDVVELDRAPAGSLSALHVDGETIAWNHDGQSRSAPAP